MKTLLSSEERYTVRLKRDGPISLKIYNIIWKMEEEKK
jgi:hypothetical protein